MGALTQLGLPADQGRSVEDAIAAGDIVIAVDADQARADRVKAILGGEDAAAGPGG